MNIDVQKVAESVVKRIEELNTQKEQIEQQRKERLSRITIELNLLRQLAGLSKRPGKSKGEKKEKEEKKKSPLIDIARQVLESRSGEILTSSEIAQIAVDTSLWESAPKSYKANMARILKNSSEFQQTEDGRFYLSDEDGFDE